MRHGSAKPRPIHPWPLRLMHWLNALAIVMMIGSGWQIYDASPLFNFTFPTLITIGGWLGAGIAWHLAFMWLLMANGLAYLIWGAATGHFRRKLWPISPSAVLQDLRRAFTVAFSTRLELAMAPADLTPAEAARAADLERDRYATDAWNRQR